MHFAVKFASAWGGSTEWPFACDPCVCCLARAPSPPSPPPAARLSCKPHERARRHLQSNTARRNRKHSRFWGCSRKRIRGAWEDMLSLLGLGRGLSRGPENRCVNVFKVTMYTEKRKGNHSCQSRRHPLVETRSNC